MIEIIVQLPVARLGHGLGKSSPMLLLHHFQPEQNQIIPNKIDKKKIKKKNNNNNKNK